MITSDISIQFRLSGQCTDARHMLYVCACHYSRGFVPCVLVLSVENMTLIIYGLNLSVKDAEHIVG